MKSSQLKATAYHEAGHAVSAWRLNIALSRKGVTIAPDQAAGNLGSTFHRRVVGGDIEFDGSNRNVIKAEKLAQICFAGEVAQRRYNPRSVRRYHAGSDRDSAFDTLSYVSADQRELEAWLRLLYIQVSGLANIFSVH